jgi:hypothetical protein
MKKQIVFICILSLSSFAVLAQDTCRVGVFVTDVFDLNLAEKSFKTKFWIWALYKKDSLKIMENLELVNAKEHEYTLTTIEQRGEFSYGAQKCKAEVKADWNITDFPFDNQQLTTTIESGDAETNELIFVPDLKNSLFDTPHIKLDGWKIKDFKVKGGKRTYSSNYGDPEIKGSANYSSIEFTLYLERDGWGLFFKLFTGLYVAFGISIMPFFMGPENAERFGLLVGSLFAAVANKYIVDSILPETTYYTLVDKIHVITFIYILIGLILTVLAYRLDVAEHRKLARRIDWVSFWTVLISFASINVYLIRQAL